MGGGLLMDFTYAALGDTQVGFKHAEMTLPSVMVRFVVHRYCWNDRLYLFLASCEATDIQLLICTATLSTYLKPKL